METHPKLPETGCAVKHTFANPFRVARELARGLTLYRALFHCELQTVRLAGRVLDLGGKTAEASYYPYIEGAKDADIVSTDLHEAPGVLALNVEHTFPLPDEEFDIVLAFNLFEHVYNYQGAPAEVFRVLKSGGRLVILVPFLHEYHADPHDYFRFTSPALQKIWTGGGLRCIRIVALAEGLLTYSLTRTASLVMPRWLYRFAAPALYLLAMPLDRLVAIRPRLDGLTMPARFPLGYLAVFEKP